MQKLKKSDRELVLKKVLTEAFEQRFLNIRDAMHAHVAADIAAKHPFFVSLLNNPDASCYLTSTLVGSVKLPDGRRAFRPVFGTEREEPNCPNTWQLIDNAAAINLSQAAYLRSPAHGHTPIVTSEEIVSQYDEAWGDYTAAYSKLSALLNSYTTREKLAEDFPEFAKHVPLAASKVRLPAVIVDDVRADLARCGVPAKEA